MSWEDPIRALATECEALLAADADDVGGVVAAHAFGMRETKAATAPPRYVWIPTRAPAQKSAVAQAVDDVKQIASFRQHFEIHCWGSTYAQAWAMVNNVVRAVDQAVAVDAQFQNARWAHPSEAWNQKGELYILELSLMVPIVDAYIQLTNLADPQSENILPEAGTAVAYLTSDLTVDGEAGPAIDIDDTDLAP